MSDLSDLRNQPHSKHGDGVWFALIVPDEIAKLTRLHRAIRKWDQIATEEFHEYRRHAESRRLPEWDEYGYDPVADEASMLLDTQRVMLANLGVSLAACAENFVIRICQARSIHHLNGRGQTDFGIACGNLGTAVGTVLARLPGYDGNQRARLLGNCFKHSEGKTNDRFVEKCGGALGVQIEYEKENWDSMIADTQQFLSGICTRLGN